MRRSSPWLLLAVVGVLFAAGRLVREELGIELRPEALRDWVQGLGLVAPIGYVAMVTFRQFLLVPSLILLAAGGLVFGTALGTLLGGAGIVLSALFGFVVARTLGREWLRVRMSGRLQAIERQSERVGPLLVALGTAHPLGPMSAVHWGAGLASVSLLSFAAVVLVAGPARAFLLSSFGSALAEPASPRFWLTTAGLVAAVLLPLAHPAVRRRIFGRGAEASAQ